MTIPRLLLVALVVASLGCGDSTAPDTTSGVWVGTYANNQLTGLTYTATLTMSQHGTNVTGTLATTYGDTATLQGTVAKSGIEGTFLITSACTALSADGTVPMVADFESSGTVLNGDLVGDTCVGYYTAHFVLTKQP